MNSTKQSEFQILQQQINKLIEVAGTPKQWLNTSEAAHYLGYSKESIHKMVKSGEFRRGIHYHKKIKRLLFNKIEIDKWVMSDEPVNSISYNEDIDKTIDDILSSIAA